jgi:protein O-GlcNAc transferase
MTTKTMTVSERPKLSVPQFMGLAWRQYRDGAREEAHAMCVRVLRVAPKNPDALHLLGILAYDAQNHALAIKLMTEAVRHAKRFAPMHGNLALAKLAVGDLAGAAMSARKAFELSPAYADAHRVLGLVHERKRQYGESIAEFERAQALGLNNDDLRTHLARVRALAAAADGAPSPDAQARDAAHG